MSRWTEDSNYLAVKRLVSEMEGLFASSSAEGFSAEDIQEFTRAASIVRALAKLVGGQLIETIPSTLWAPLIPSLTRASTHLSRGLSKKQPLELKNANAALDEALLNGRGMIFAPAGDDVIAAEVARGLLEATKAEVILLKAKIAEADTRSEELRSLMGRLQAQSGDLDSYREKQEVKFSEGFDRFTEQFSAAQTNRDTLYSAEIFEREQREKVRWSELLSRVEEDVDKHLGEWQSAREDARRTADAQIEALRGQLQQATAYLSSQKAEVEKIVGAIGSTALAGQFNSNADSERSSADKWRLLAMTLMLLLAGLTVGITITSLTHPIELEDFAYRIGMIIVLGFPAGYAASEFSKHRALERKNRRLQLELATIDSFLALLPEASRSEIKGVLAYKYFGATEEPDKEEAVEKKALLEIIATAVSNLTKGR